MLDVERTPERTEAFSPLATAWFLTGPTASGKSTVALELAPRINAEIVSLDSMAVYRGMDIGTAKPSLEARAHTPHHLLDIVEPTVDYSLAEYVAAAHQVAGEIVTRGKRPLFVGGTPLYLKALLRGFYQGPPPDWDFRRAVEDEIRSVGLGALRARLEQVDPLSAYKLHPNDQRRMIRALEVHRATGVPLSHLQTQFEEQGIGTGRAVVLHWDRAALHRRVDDRVQAMFAMGLVDETRELLTRHGGLSRTASQAVGYRETVEHLAGGADLPTTIERTQAATRQFARRQETWFRGLAELAPIGMSEPLDAGAIARAIAGRFQSV